VYGRDIYARCDALTAGLVGELTEQLRLILEPTLASRLAGDFRSGKRINMKKVRQELVAASPGKTDSKQGCDESSPGRAPL
jgi:midasin (ATPase involved in ribosome maturation)